ncbi:hypothetical protein IQ247_10055 [Plectonema cf. radiosum LEGE 06105]|uniref:Uncharacterized protein n=1 Tax=Plectonema cf. radiosum LEGE 06105 TaxID=945769 RepID=A0A8J7F1E2_9CYAN|nr:hypothetical protein [Plectonema radiosum]MBE9213017.1 hypothetical protein [Plectonema cf. radiosum LEGE 06105]
MVTVHSDIGSGLENPQEVSAQTTPHIHTIFTASSSVFLKLEECTFLIIQKKSDYPILACESERVFYTSMILVIAGSIKFE